MSLPESWLSGCVSTCRCTIVNVREMMTAVKLPIWKKNNKDGQRHIVQFKKKKNIKSEEGGHEYNWQRKKKRASKYKWKTYHPIFRPNVFFKDHIKKQHNRYKDEK